MGRAGDHPRGGGVRSAGQGVHVTHRVGIPVGRSQLVLAPALSSWTLFGSTGSEGAVAGIIEPGGSIGFSAQLGDSVLNDLRLFLSGMA